MEKIGAIYMVKRGGVGVEKEDMWEKHFQKILIKRPKVMLN